MTKYYDYRILFPDGRAYVGVSPHPEVSFSEHCSADTATGQAIRRHGRHNCKLEICKGDITQWAEPVTEAARHVNRSRRDREGNPKFLNSIKVHARSTFDAADSELASRLDVIFAPFISAEGRLDWCALEITANADGRRAIYRIFRGWIFPWRQAKCPWKGWRSTVLQLPRPYSIRDNCVPVDVVRLDWKKQVTPQQLSILASAASALGARAGWLTLGSAGQPIINLPK